MKTLYLDCFCGISGDMTVGALIDAGADARHLLDVAASLGLEGVKLEVAKVDKKGIRATRFRVLTDPKVHQPHRHLSHVLTILRNAAVEEAVKDAAADAFKLIGLAEAEVHGVPLEKVHFHEVGAVDSIVDIVLANTALHSLGIKKVFCSTLVVGTGSVACDHGILPVPAPATALLLRGIPWRAGEVPYELVTPTGAALAKQWAAAFMPMPDMRVESVGYGAGTRELQDRANVLRVFVGEQPEQLPALEPISVLETTIDDMNPELTALLAPLLLEAGARDVFTAAVMGKKGRMAQHITVLSDPDKAGALARLIFANSVSLGVRVREERRWVLERETRHVNTPWGRVRVKIGLLEGAETAASPEFEDCRALAEANALPVRVIYASALAAAVRGEYVHE